MSNYKITRTNGDNYLVALVTIEGDEIEFGDPICGLQAAIDTANSDCWERSDAKPEHIEYVNMKSTTITPRTAQQFNDHPWVDKCFRDDDGWWVWLKPGFWSTNMECGTLREDTVKQLIEQWQYVEVAPISYIKQAGYELEDAQEHWDEHLTLGQRRAALDKLAFSVVFYGGWYITSMSAVTPGLEVTTKAHCFTDAVKSAESLNYQGA